MNMVVQEADFSKQKSFYISNNIGKKLMKIFKKDLLKKLNRK